VKRLLYLSACLVAAGLFGLNANAQLTVIGGDLNVPNDHINIGGTHLKIYNDGEMAWNSPGQPDWTLRPNGAAMFRIGTSSSPSGANTFVINEVGQVGFGGVPSTQFDIKGPMKLYGSLGGAEMMFDPQTASAWTIRGGEGGLFRIGSTDTGANLLVLNNDGRVGINTTSPSAALDVANGGIHSYGAIDSDDLLQVGDTKLFDGELQYRLAGEPQWTVRASGASLYRIGNDTVGDANMFVINEAGQIGIGTAGPGRQLDVNGQVRIQDLPASSSDLIVVADANGDLRVRDASTIGGSSSCVECADVETVVFETVCKLISATNFAELTECVTVIGSLALLGQDVCTPNEADCLSVILGNVQDLVDSKQ